MAWPSSNTQPKSLLHLAPNRCWEPAGNTLTGAPYGQPLFASREWRKGEKLEYLMRIGATNIRPEEKETDDV